jgi:DNA-binding MarR family transcriptional regulator
MATADLKSELKQSKPFRSLAEEAILSVVRTSAFLNDSFDRMLRPHGITTAQYNVLRILRGAGEDGLCRNEIRDRMITRMPDMTRLLDRMEVAGLVVRERGNSDRRMVNTLVTAKGRKLLDKLDSEVEAEHERCVGHLSDAQIRALISTLAAVRSKG